MKQESRPAALEVADDVLFREIGDELVLLHLATGFYYGLDPLGARIWRLLGDKEPPALIARRLAGEYDVTPEELARDIEQLIADLQAHHLLKSA